MDRKGAKKHLEVIKAFAEGKTIEYYDDGKEEWVIIQNPGFITDYKYRVKPEPSIRPYKSKEEFLHAFKEHGPFININNRFCSIIELGDFSVVTKSYTLTFESLLSRNIRWCDGTKCCIIEE